MWLNILTVKLICFDRLRTNEQHKGSPCRGSPVVQHCGVLAYSFQVVRSEDPGYQRSHFLVTNTTALKLLLVLPKRGGATVLSLLSRIHGGGCGLRDQVLGLPRGWEPWDQQHRVDWENASVLRQQPGYWKRRVLEAIEIQRHAENTNLDCGLTLNSIWTPFLT